MLVTGPTGIGKSTTLAAMIDHINKTRHDHIITIEDPIEFVHENKTLPGQPARGRTAHRGLQARAARRAARGSRHRPGRRDARPRDDRDRDRDAPRPATSSSARCTRPPRPRPSTASSISSRPTGRRRSASCSPSRLKGVDRADAAAARSAAAASRRSRSWSSTAPSANLIREGKTLPDSVDDADRPRTGHGALNDALIELVTKKLVEPEEAYLKAVDKAGFEGLLKRGNVDTTFVSTVQ